MTTPERNFRPEIQALRAIAVGSVLLFHLFPDQIPGGYVGVDVFFVISGFLITDHLAREAVSTGRISLLRFWARRIRRLLPAATFVLAVSLVAMIAFTPRPLWQRTVTEIGASALYVQNWVLGFGAVDYLGAGNTPTLVQHYWSLSVEEQFYIVWPIVLLAAIVVAGRRLPRRAIAIALAVVFVVSLGYSIIDTERSQAFAYFNTGTRAWEFAAGGLLALVPAALLHKGGKELNPLARILASWAGLALIVVAALRFNVETAFPGAIALIPVAGTVLVIAAGIVSSVWSPSLFFRFGPVQFIGDLSYGIYLWHWPLIVVVTSIANHAPGWKWKTAIIVASVVLAWVTKRVVEDPIRRGAYWNRGVPRSFALGVASIALLVASTSITWTVVQVGIDDAATEAQSSLDTDECFGAPALYEKGCAEPFAVPSDVDTAFAAQDGFYVPGICTFPQPEVALQVCEYGELVHPTTTVVLVGNSHATELVSSALRYGEDRGWKIVLMTKRNCLGITNDAVGVVPDQSCLDWSKAVLNTLHNTDGIDLVVFPSHRSVLTYIAPDDPSQQQLDELRSQIAANFQSLVDDGLNVAVIGDTPEAPSNVPQCVDRNRATYDPCGMPNTQDPANIVTEAADLVSGVTYIDPRPWFCDASRCHSVIGGVVVYFDNNHMSGTFSRSLAPILGADLEKALAR